MSKLELNPTDQPRFTIADLSEPVAKELKQIWVKASIPKLAQAYVRGGHAPMREGRNCLTFVRVSAR